MMMTLLKVKFVFYFTETGSDYEDNVSFISDRREKRDSAQICPSSMGPNVNIKNGKKKPFYTVEERTSFSRQLKFKEKTEVNCRLN